MESLERLKRRRDFVRTAHQGVHFPMPAFVLQIVPQSPSLGISRVGFTVTKKLGKAVLRNRIRRRLKAAVAQLPGNAFQAGYDYVVIARPLSLVRPFLSLQEDLKFGLKKLHQKLPIS